MLGSSRGMRDDGDDGDDVDDTRFIFDKVKIRLNVSESTHDFNIRVNRYLPTCFSPSVAATSLKLHSMVCVKGPITYRKGKRSPP